jgi:uncharacterized protein with HEPN domain
MKDDQLFLQHILAAIEAVDEYLQGASRITFVQNRMQTDAVVRQLEIIGEAARNLSDECRDAHRDIEWGQIIGMRNRLIHAYFRVDIELVWEIVTTDLPVLKGQVESILAGRR